MESHITEERLKKILKEYGEDNWDGYGAKKIKKKDIKPALKFVPILKKHFIDIHLELIECYPDNLNNICYECFFNHGNQASITLLEDYTFQWIVLITKNGETVTIDGVCSFDKPEPCFDSLRELLRLERVRMSQRKAGKKYGKTKKGQKSRKRYENSKKGKNTRAQYASSEKRKLTQEKYEKSKKGKLTRKKSKDKLKAKKMKKLKTHRKT